MIFDDDAISSYIYPSVSDDWAEHCKFNLLTVRGRGQGPSIAVVGLRGWVPRI